MIIIQMDNQQVKSQQNKEGAEELQAPPVNEEDIKKQLKDKNKQIKVLQTKNSKLQAKYVELFKQQKTYKKNITILTDFVKFVLPNYDVTRLDIEELKLEWTNKEDQRNRKSQQQKEDIEKSKKDFEERVQEDMELKIQTIEMENKAQIQSISKQLQSFKKNNKNLMEQIGELDKKLDGKSDEVSKLTKQKLKLEHQINQLKMDSITQQLSDGKKVADQKSALDRNEFLALRQQVDSLMEKRDSLRKQLKEARSQNDNITKQLNAKTSQIEKLTLELQQQKKSWQIGQKVSKMEEPNMLQKKESISSISSIEEDRLRDDMHHLSEDDEYVHRQYMKNVFIRYMNCWGNGDSAQADVLLNIILTLLKLNKQQTQTIVAKRKNWWKVY